VSRAIHAAAAALLVPLMISCSETASDGVSMISGQAFEPARVVVEPGATVTFTNDSQESHTVTAYESGFPSGATYFSSGGSPGEHEARGDLTGGLLAPGDSFEVTLDVPGTYDYFCIPHEGAGMTGTIVVEGE
jgi:plastocyanin